MEVLMVEFREFGKFMNEFVVFLFGEYFWVIVDILVVG